MTSGYLSHALFLTALLGASVAPAEALKDDARKKALHALTRSEEELMSSADLLSRFLSDSRSRERQLEKRSRKLGAWLRLHEQLQRAAEEEAKAQEASLGPRLQALYRLTRHKPWSLWLLADSFTEAFRATRAFRRWVEAELQALERWQRASFLAQQGARELSVLKERLLLEKSAWETARLEAVTYQEALDEWRDWVQAEKGRAGRWAKEQERAQGRLTQLLPQGNSLAAQGFEALKGRLPWPTPGLIEVAFGKVVNPRFNTVLWQKGLDLRAAPGAEVKAVAKGQVVYADWLKGYGNLVILDHGEGYHTLHAHLGQVSVANGGTLEEGDVLGEVGDTGSLKGPYLYFELRHRGSPLDPAEWLGEEGPK
jgi:septal ring factor EnvC (AmiA/AmiB activator)